MAIKEYDSLEDYQVAVGGYVEAIYAGDEGLSLFANEEAKLIGLQLNRRATLLWQLQLHPTPPHDILGGDVVLVGPSDADGATLDVPDAVQRLLFTPSTYLVEVRVPGTGAWHPAPQVFSDYFEAIAWGLPVVQLEDGTADLRIVASS
ncbi:MAG: DUF3846 domain-containing protein [Nocardioides sp.]